jgi:hypothetical protein
VTAPAPTPDDTMHQAVRVVLASLPQDRQATAAEIDANVDLVCAMQQARGRNLDRDALSRMIQATVAIWQDSPLGLSDDSDHVEWLDVAMAERSWDFWDRYRRYLEDVRTMPPTVVRRLDQSTRRILGQIEDPRRPGRWRRTGLVVGQVQSGKTGNYIGLVCKAADAGYKLIVILAGIHNSLRSQTQLRIDEGLLGFDTQYQQRYDQETGSSRIGVGAMPGVRRLKIASLTTSAEKGDFKRNVASNMNLPIGDYPVVLVVKKHRSILEYIRKWIVEVEGQETANSADRIVHDVPLLIIDDEADNASVDTSREDDTDPTRINAAIRRLLNSFDKAAYIGYTATPFANIYIDPDADHTAFGIDLFPDSFIETLPAPTNYFGPEKVFGLSDDDPDPETSVEALPIVRKVRDHETWMPARHRKDWVPPDPLPTSLTEALDAFILTCAARRVRGQGTEHSSMLIHVTRFVDVQNRVKDQVEEYVALTADRLRDVHSGQSAAVAAQLRQLWERDFVPTTSSFPAEEAPPVGWEQVAAELRPATAKIRVRAVNGSARDALEYYEHRRTGLSLIAIGGDKLSRGLTLEGLSVSYYLRASNTYDTLLQMGRWFGYRPGYEDLCRLYTPPALLRAYEEITAADNELRRDFAYMVTLGETPTTFGLRVRTSPAGLAVTAANKMRRGVKVKVSYSGEIPETTTFSLAEEAKTRNFQNLRRFITRLDGSHISEQRNGGTLWRQVPAADIVDGFLDGYVPDRRSYRVRPAFIAEYIRRCVQLGELTQWTVLLAGNPRGRLEKIGTREVGLVTRSAHELKATEGSYTIRRVLSPSDESADLSPEQRERALEGTRTARMASAQRRGKPYVEPDVPSGQPLRQVRDVNQPLLIIYPIQHQPDSDTPAGTPLVGFAISFPYSRQPTATEYVVNEIWRQQELEDLDDGDADE